MEKNYSLRKASVILGIKVRTLRWWVTTGKVKAFKLRGGRMWMIPQSELERLTKDADED